MPPPNLFIVGAPRCGTTSMSRYLGSHERVAASPKKEPMYHAPDLLTRGAVRDLDRYLALFSGTGEYRLEASPWYLYSKEAASSIAAMTPEARIIVQLRDPADCIASLYGHHRFVGIEPAPSIDEAVFGDRTEDPHDFRPGLDYLAVVSFSEQLARFESAFPPEQIHAVLFDDLAGDPRQVHLGVLRFLGLPEVPLPEYPRLNVRRARRSGAVARATSAIGGTGKPRWQRMAAARLDRLNTVPDATTLPRGFRRKVAAALAEDVTRLERQLDRDLSSWRTA